MLKITRRGFVQLLGGGSAAAIACGCGGSEAPPTPDAPPANCATIGAACTIADNHVHALHELVVTAAEIAAGTEKVYDIMGLASHNHQVTITAADFTTLQAGGTIMVTSTVTFCHSHVCTVSCGTA